MPVVIDRPPAHIRELGSLYELNKSCTAASSDGMELLRQYTRVRSQWMNRQGFESPAVQDDLGYRHVPFRRVGTLKVRFLPAQPMGARSVNLDEDDSDAE